MRNVTTALASILLLSASLAQGQGTAWQSMDGPYVNETRYHARLSSGERVFVGSESGTYRSSDNGASWTKVAPPTSTVNGLYLGSGDVLYTTGAVVNMGRSNQGITYGAYRSTDKGATWVDIGGGYNLRLAPGRGDTLYRTIGRGDIVYGATAISVSTDRGTSWVQVAQPDYSGPVAGFSSLYLHHGQVFSLMATGAFPDMTTRSSDGGTTWQQILGSSIIFHPPGHLIALRKQWNAYQALAGADLAYSSDNGATWNTVLHADSGFGSMIDNGQGTILVLSNPGSILKRSTDKGATWTSLGGGLPPEGLRSISYLGRTRVIGVGKEGHLYRSLDHGTSWHEVTDNAHSLPLRALQPTLDSVLIASDFRGDWVESTDAGSSWTARSLRFELQKMTSIAALPSGTIAAGSMQSLHWKRGAEPWSSGTGGGPVWAVSYDGHQHIYAGSGKHLSSGIQYNGSLTRIDTAGTSTRWIYGGNITYYYSYPDWFSVVPMSHERIVTGWATRIATFSDSLSSPKVSTGTGAGNFNALLRSSSSVLFAGNLGSGVYRSADSGTTWTQVNSGITDQSIYALARDSSGQIYAGASGGVFRSSNSGASWIPINNGLPAAAVQALAVSGAGHIYAGTPAGVYINTGTAWERWSDGLTVQDIPALAIDRDQNVLAGSWGAGMYSRPSFSVPVPMNFTTVQSSPILADMSQARAAVWADYDNDGDPDLFIANAGGTLNQLYRYDGWPTGFTKVSVGAMVNEGGDASDAAWGDYDGDGSVDLVVVNAGSPPFLYHNNGNGSFTKITSGPITTGTASGMSATWADYDNDGRLDLLITRGAGLDNSLFHNEGNGTFIAVPGSVIAQNGAVSVAAAWGDYDADGYLDLYVANDGDAGALYHNNGNGTFDKTYPTAITSVIASARSCGWVDMNNDGRPDLWVYQGNQKPLLLYRNDGNSQFTEVLRGYVWTDAVASRPIAWGDFDNDGDLDFFLAGNTVRSMMYLNDGTGQFTKTTSGMPMLDHAMDGPASWADYSGDGNLDLFVANTLGSRQLYWSDGIGRSALRVRCAGTLSDTRGVGARVAAKATINGKTSWYFRTGDGRNDLSMHFGMGDATAVDSVVVHWPITGVQVLSPVEIDANLTVTEPATRSTPILLYPSQRGADIPTTTPLRWRSSAGATTYHLQISTDTLFASLEFNDSTLVDTSKVLGPFAMATTYFWRVRAHGAFLTTPWTETWRFSTVMPIPDAPLLAAPPPDAVRQWTSGLLIWRKSPRASRYHVQFAADSLFTTMFLNDSTLADTSKPYEGSFASRYYWHVRAINGSGSSAFSTFSAFNTVSPPPPPPLLALPADQGELTTVSARLSWFRPARGERYQVQVALDSLFSARIINDSALTDTFRVIPLTPGKTYHWRVRASGEGGFSPYSGTRSFTSTLAQPLLARPYDRTTAWPRTLTLVWQPVPGATSYHAQVSSDSLFSGALMLNDSTLADTSTIVSGLAEHTQYYWRVSAQTEYAIGPFSQVWRFATALGIPGLASPADNATNQSISLALAWHPIGSATGYHLQVARTAAFDSGMIANDSSLVDTTRVLIGLLHNTQYYWRVRGRTILGPGTFSPPWSFRTIQIQPGKPELAYPHPNLSMNANVVAFVWHQATPQVTRYWHELASDSAFFLKVIDSTIVDTTLLRTGLPNGSYWWRVRAYNSAGWGMYSDTRKFSVSVTGIGNDMHLPTVFSLDQNYPNPFNPTTLLRFGLPAASDVTLSVYNILGQEVVSVLHQQMDAGFHILEVDGSNLSSGVYFYRLRAGSFVDTKRMLLVK